VADLESKYRPHLEGELEPGEALDGLLVASQQKGLFKGGAVVIGVTPGRLLLCELDRRGNPNGAIRSIRPGDLAGAKAGDAGGGWLTIGAEIMDRAAARLELRLRDGERLKLMLMRGSGPLGGLGGGEDQRSGVEALAGWFRRLDQP
jgi:hypothetical protein